MGWDSPEADGRLARHAGTGGVAHSRDVSGEVVAGRVGFVRSGLAWSLRMAPVLPGPASSSLTDSLRGTYPCVRSEKVSSGMMGLLDSSLQGESWLPST